MERSKILLRRFRKQAESPHVETSDQSSAMQAPESSQPFTVQVSTRTDSLPVPPLSVEPPRLDRYLMYGSPAPIDYTNPPLPVAIGRPPSAEGDGASSVPEVVTAETGQYWISNA